MSRNTQRSAGDQLVSRPSLMSGPTHKVQTLDSLYLHICARLYMYTHAYIHREDHNYLWVSSPDSPAAFLASLRGEAFAQ